MVKVRLLVLLAASLTSAIGAAQEAGDKSQAPVLIPEPKNESPTPAKPASCCGKAANPEAKQGEPRDVAFEQFVDLKMLADAWLEMKPSELLDCALQFRHAEQTLKREHKLISSRELLDYATRAATAKQDQPTLKRLGRVAEMIKDPQLATLVKLGAESRAAEADELAISVDDLSPADFRLVKEVIEGVENATTDGNLAGLDDLLKAVKESEELPAAQKEMLAGKIASARESLPEDGKSFAAIMQQLTGASRAVDAGTAKYIYEQMLTPRERREIQDAGMRTAFNEAKRLGLLTDPALAALPDLMPGQPIPPDIQNWWRTDPTAQTAQIPVDLNVNGVRVTYVVSPGGAPQGLPFVDYDPSSRTYLPPQTSPLSQVPSIIRPGLDPRFDPTRGVIGVPDPTRLQPPPLPPIQLVGGLPYFTSGSSMVPMFLGPFGPVIGPPMPLPPTAMLLPLPTSGPLPDLPPLPPPPPLPTTLVTTTVAPPPGPPTVAPPPGGPALTCNDVLGTWHEDFAVAAGMPGNRVIYVFTGGMTPLAGTFQMWQEEQDPRGLWERVPGSDVDGTFITTPGSPFCNLQVVDTAGLPIMDVDITFLGHAQENGINVIMLQGDRTVNGNVDRANLIR